MNRLRVQRLLVASVLVLAAFACGGPEHPDGGSDGGTRDGGGDGAVFLCAANTDCDDGLYCNGEETCVPGDPAAGSDGCVPGSAPCSASTCNESTASCACDVNPDADEDGHDSVACGGDDCDDADPNRYPGNAEVCDTDGHDEDCDGTTVGDQDADSDGAVDAACCNGDTCGTDCDDGDTNVNPSAAEACDGLDNDCTGVVDDATGLCPGGLCVGGACDFDAWDSVFGTVEDDQASSVAIDGAGNVYVAASVGEGTLNFGGGDRTIPTGREAVVVVKYSADGTYQWDYVNSGGSRAGLLRIAVNDAGTRVYLVGYSQGDLGSGAATGDFFMVLDGDGAYQLDRRFGSTSDRFSDVVVNAVGVVVAGKFWQTVDFGGGDRAAGDHDSIVVLQFDADGAYVWDRVFSVASTGYANANAVAVGASGAIAIGGTFSGDLSLGTALSGSGAYVSLLDSSGAPQWAHPILHAATTGIQALNAVAVGSTDEVYAVGYYTGSVDLGTGTTYGSSSGENGFILGLTATGSPDWGRSLGSTGGDDSATDVTMSFSGDVLVVGEFSTDTDFGRGTVRPASTDGFLARYAPDGVPRRDAAFSTTFTRVLGVASGPGDMVVVTGLFSDTGNFGSVTRVSAGGTDAFVLRVGT